MRKKMGWLVAIMMTFAGMGVAHALESDPNMIEIAGTPNGKTAGFTVGERVNFTGDVHTVLALEFLGFPEDFSPGTRARLFEVSAMVVGNQDGFPEYRIELRPFKFQFGDARVGGFTQLFETVFEKNIELGKKRSIRIAVSGFGIAGNAAISKNAELDIHFMLQFFGASLEKYIKGALPEDLQSQIGVHIFDGKIAANLSVLLSNKLTLKWRMIDAGFSFDNPTVFYHGLDGSVLDANAYALSRLGLVFKNVLPGDLEVFAQARFDYRHLGLASEDQDSAGSYDLSWSGSRATVLFGIEGGF